MTRLTVPPLTRRRLARLALVALAGLVLAATAAGIYRATADPPPRDPQAVADQVAESLRCPTCQGLSVADSPSDLAAGMREIITAQAEAGRSPEEIRGYFLARYGQWILLSPPRRGLSGLVWLLPVLALLAGFGLAVRMARRGRQVPAADPDALARAEGIYHAWRAGRYRIDDTCPEGERVEAALQLRETTEQDDDGDPAEAGAARAVALNRLAAALADYRDRAPSTAEGEPRRRWRHAATAAVIVAFAATLVALLQANTGARGPDGLPTGINANPTTAASEADRLAALDAATRQRPNDPQTWAALGDALAAENSLSAAETAYRQAHELDPDDTEVTASLASVLIRAGHGAQAVPLVEPLVEQNPTNPRAVLLLGLAHNDTGSPQARPMLERFLRLAPDDPMAPQVRALLERN